MVWFVAGQEARLAVMKSNRNSIPPWHIMIRDFYTADVTDTLSQLSDRILGGKQTDFPVMNDQGESVGMIGAERLLDGLAQLDPSTQIGNIMMTEFETINLDQPVESALNLYQGKSGSFVPVLEKGQLVGLIPWRG